MVWIILFLLTTRVHFPGTEADMSVYLPQSAEMTEWEPIGAPQYAKGEDLFLLINGGAEIYHEYGFKQAVIQGFKNKKQESLKFNLEIYEMQNPEAAYGIYTFKTGDSGKVIDVGGDGLLEDYYLNFWKGRFLVTAIGFDAKEETVNSLIKAAKIVAAKIKETGRKPGLIDRLPGDYGKQLRPHGIKYIKGDLGLFNHLDFARDILGIEEGVIGFYKDFKLYILKYKDAEECRKSFESAKKRFKNDPRYTDFLFSENGFSMKDKNGKPFYIEYSKEYIHLEEGGGSPHPKKK